MRERIARFLDSLIAGEWTGVGSLGYSRRKSLQTADTPLNYWTTREPVLVSVAVNARPGDKYSATGPQRPTSVLCCGARTETDEAFA